MRFLRQLIHSILVAGWLGMVAGFFIVSATGELRIAKLVTLALNYLMILLFLMAASGYRAVHSLLFTLCSALVFLGLTLEEYQAGVEGLRLVVEILAVFGLALYSVIVVHRTGGIFRPTRGAKDDGREFRREDRHHE